MKACLLAVLLSLVPGLTSPDAPKPEAILGVLEDVPAKYVGQPDVRAVRAVFQKRGDDWQAFPSDCGDEQCLKTITSEFPGEVTWTIAFDGRNLGSVTTRTPKEYGFYADVGLQDIVSAGPVPTIGTKSGKYAGFLGSPVFRPLIANREPYFSDPEKWKRAQLPPALIASVRKKFRQMFPKATNCSNPDESIARPWLYDDQNIQIASVYSSLKRWFVVQTLLGPYRCDGPQDDSFQDQWFVINPSNEIRFLGKTMWLVDAGDYDHDGRSEIVFSIAGYDLGGYEIFYDDFKKHATFEFSYH